MVPSRNPVGLFRALSELKDEHAGIERDLCIRLIGSVDHSVFSAIESLDLSDFVEKIDYLPHNEVVTEQTRAAVLLLVLNKSFSAKRIVTGKVFEYLAAERPILALGDEESDVAEILEQAGAGFVIDHDSVEKIKERIIDLYESWKYQINDTPIGSYTKFSRKSLTGDLVEILNSIT